MAAPARQIESDRTTSAAAASSRTVPAERHWTEAPGYVLLFAPELHRSTYRAYVSALTLEEALRALTEEPSLLHPPGAWEPRAVGALEAFGRSGTYNPWNLSRLYAGTPVSLAVGPRAERGRVIETWTLISPYPDLGLARLERGTLLLVAQVSPLLP